MHEIAEDPQVEEIPSGGGEFAIERLYSTPIGSVLIQGTLGSLHVIAFGPDGWARQRYWARRRNKDVLTALVRLGVTEQKAREIATELAPHLDALRPPQG
jgi:hypothetical protein